MNHHKEPSIYALVAPDGGFFYVGRTTINAQNRLWEHIYRARSGHQAPVYQRMRELGIEMITYKVLQFVEEGDDPRELEARWIKKLLGDGIDLVNAWGRDGVPDSWSREYREKGQPSKRGKATWITGKTGEAAGWTPERRAQAAERMRELNKKKTN